MRWIALHLPMPFSKKTETERKRVDSALDDASVRQLAENTYQRFEALLASPDNAWKNEFPGKGILNRFCKEAEEKEDRLKTLYIRKSLEADTNPFQEIIDIFSSFAKA